MTQSFVQIGNSRGVIIPKELFQTAGVHPTQKFWIEADSENKAFIIHTKEKSRKKVSTSPKLLAILEKVNKEYGPALKKLASL